MRNLKTLAMVSILLWIAACNTQTKLSPSEQPNEQQTEEQLRLAQEIEADAYTRLESQEARILNHPNYQNGTRAIVYLNAGSVDGLQDAINQAGPWGKVIVNPGLHIENQMVTVSHPVRIIGQNGAIIQSNVAPVLGQDPDDPSTFPHLINPALLVDGASFVVIRKLKFIPDPNTGFGELAIALQEADHAVVRSNKFEDFGSAVAVNQSDFVVVRKNMGNGTYSEGAPISSGTAIVVASGESAIIAQNAMEDFGVGYFFSDKNGVAIHNSAKDTELGFIWCTWPTNGTILPTGDYIAADFSASNWSGVRNQSENSLLNGFMIIDGANQNLIVSNNATNSGASDIEFYGILGTFPTSADNLFIAGAFPNVGVRDCGLNNTIIGGILNTDPCQ